MTNPLTPVFSSPELQKTLTDARPILEGVDEARNRVSNDIKQLEAYLQSIELKTPFRFPLGKGFFSSDGGGRSAAAALEYGGSAPGEIQEDALCWAEDKKGTFRLLYEFSCWQGFIDIDAPGGPLFWEEETLTREAKPLIDTKFEIRKQMYQRLPEFVAGLAKHLDVGQKLKLEDVPF